MAATPEQLNARAAQIETQLAKWQGIPEYAETLRMEIAALRAHAAMKLAIQMDTSDASRGEYHRGWGAAMQMIAALDDVAESGRPVQL